MIGFDPDCDHYYDPQQQKPRGWCPICRREIWSDGMDFCTACTNAQKGQNLDVEDVGIDD